MYYLFFFFTLALVVCEGANYTNTTTTTTTSSKPKMLQIGIKKRMENCTAKSKKGDLLHLHYNATLETGLELDSSYPNNQPITFTLGSGQVIKGWDQGLMGMCIGEHRKLVIPPDLAYGSIGVPPVIPEDTTLIFYVELLDIERRSEL